MEYYYHAYNTSIITSDPPNFNPNTTPYLLHICLISDFDWLDSFLKNGDSEVIQIVMNISQEVFDENISDMDNTADICDDECKNTIWGFWIEGVAVPFIAFFGIFGEYYRKMKIPSKKILDFKFYTIKGA